MVRPGRNRWRDFPQFYIKAKNALRLTLGPALALPLLLASFAGSLAAENAAGKSASAKAEEEPPIILALPPSGFQHLTEPQTLEVDVYYQGRRVGVTMATYSPGRLKFANPDEVVAKLPDVAEVDRVRAALKGALDTNSRLVCGPVSSPQCGRLEPKVAGIIFDPGRYRVEVFVNPSLLAQLAGIRPAFMPVPDAGFSALQSVAAAYAGNSETDGKFNIGSHTILGYDQARIVAYTALSDDDGFAVDRLTGEWERPGWLYSGGLYRSAVVPLLGDQPFYGLRVNSSVDTRLDLQQARGTQLQVFLPRRAQVDILREGRLLSTASYAAGNRVLDTSNLPGGAYDVTLRIREAGGLVREEKRFFSKSAKLPPKDSPRYVLEFGVLAGTDFSPFPTPDDRPILHGGTTYRMGDSFALGADAFLSTESSALEGDAYYQGLLGSVGIGAFAATDGSYGAALNAFGSVDRFSYTLSLRRIWGGDNPVIPAQPSLPNTANGTTTQATSSVTYGFENGARASLRGYWRQTDGAGDSYSVGPSVYYPLYRNRGLRVDLTAEAAYGDLESVARIRLRLVWDTPSHYVTASTGYQHAFGHGGPTDSGFLGDVEAVWKDQDLVVGDLQLGAGAETDPQGASARIKGDYAGPRGRADASVERDFYGAQTTRYGGNLSFNVLGNDGAVTLGGRDASRSGVIIALDGDASADTAFDVLVNGYPRAQVHNGDRLPLLLSEYKVYDIRLKPRNAPAISFDSRDREVSLYPGTIKTLRWEVDRVVTVFGRIVRKDGSPIRDARLDGAVEPAYTDSEGYFQAVISKRATLDIRSGGGVICKVDVNAAGNPHEFAMLGDQVCG